MKYRHVRPYVIGHFNKSPYGSMINLIAMLVNLKVIDHVADAPTSLEIDNCLVRLSIKFNGGKDAHGR